MALLVGYSPNWVRTIIRRYNADRSAGGVDRCGANPGARPLLSPVLREELRDVLSGPAPDGGLWTGPKVAAWMTDRVGRPVEHQRVNAPRLGASPLPVAVRLCLCAAHDLRVLLRRLQDRPDTSVSTPSSRSGFTYRCGIRGKLHESTSTK